MSMPTSLAAVQIVVPSGTVISWPSMVRLTVLTSVGVGVEMATIASGSPCGRLRDPGNTTGRPRGYPEAQVAGLPSGEQTVSIQTAGRVVGLDHGVEALARERGAAPRGNFERLAEEPLGQAVVGARPAL